MCASFACLILMHISRRNFRWFRTETFLIIWQLRCTSRGVGIGSQRGRARVLAFDWLGWQPDRVCDGRPEKANEWLLFITLCFYDMLIRFYSHCVISLIKTAYHHRRHNHHLRSPCVSAGIQKNAPPKRGQKRIEMIFVAFLLVFNPTKQDLYSFWLISVIRWAYAFDDNGGKVADKRVCVWFHASARAHLHNWSSL